MRRAPWIMLAVVTVAVWVGPLAAQAAYDGIITVDSVTARPSDAVKVNVRLRNNDLAISAITIPLKFTSAALTLDSVSMNGTVWNSDFNGHAIIDNAARTVKFTVLPNGMDDPLPAVTVAEGIVAVLHFRVAPAAAPQQVEVDSIYVDSILGGDIHLITRIDISDNTGTRVYQPGFTLGGVEILSPTGVDDDSNNSALPSNFALNQNYPNPFNPSTTISYALPRSGMVKLEVFNILGQQVATLFEGHRDAGLFTAEFDGSNQPSGIYFYRLRHTAGVETRKMMLLK